MNASKNRDEHDINIIKNAKPHYFYVIGSHQTFYWAVSVAFIFFSFATLLFGVGASKHVCAFITDNNNLLFVTFHNWNYDREQTEKNIQTPTKQPLSYGMWHGNEQQREINWSKGSKTSTVFNARGDNEYKKRVAISMYNVYFFQHSLSLSLLFSAVCCSFPNRTNKVQTLTNYWFDVYQCRRDFFSPFIFKINTNERNKKKKKKYFSKKKLNTWSRYKDSVLKKRKGKIGKENIPQRTHI